MNFIYLCVLHDKKDGGKKKKKGNENESFQIRCTVNESFSRILREELPVLSIRRCHPLISLRDNIF